MSLSESIVQNLLEDHDYSCVMIPVAEEIAEKIKMWGMLNIPEDDLYTEEGEGRETETHVTAFYGLEMPVPVKDLLKVVEKTKPFPVEIGKVSLFKQDAYDVVKLEVASPELTKLHQRLDQFPNENKYPDYKPHVTVAYVKKGKADKLAGNQVLDGNFRKFVARTAIFSGKGKAELKLTLFFGRPNYLPFELEEAFDFGKLSKQWMRDNPNFKYLPARMLASYFLKPVFAVYFGDIHLGAVIESSPGIWKTFQTMTPSREAYPTRDKAARALLCQKQQRESSLRQKVVPVCEALINDAFDFKKCMLDYDRSRWAEVFKKHGFKKFEEKKLRHAGRWDIREYWQKFYNYPEPEMFIEPRYNSDYTSNAKWPVKRIEVTGMCTQLDANIIVWGITTPSGLVTLRFEWDASLFWKKSVKTFDQVLTDLDRMLQHPQEDLFLQSMPNSWKDRDDVTEAKKELTWKELMRKYPPGEIKKPDRFEQVWGDFGDPWVYGGGWHNPEQQLGVYFDGIESLGTRDTDPDAVELPPEIEVQLKEQYPDWQGEEADDYEEAVLAWKTRSAEETDANKEYPVYRFLVDNPMDADDEEEIASFIGQTLEQFREYPLVTKWFFYGDYHGFHELDCYPDGFSKIGLSRYLGIEL